MAAYAAVISLEHTINGLIDSSPQYFSTYSTAEKVAISTYGAVLKHVLNGILNPSPSSPPPPSRILSPRAILDFACNETTSLQRVLEGLNSRSRSRSSMERLDVLEVQIRDCANKLQDFLEFHEMKLERYMYGDEGVMAQEFSSFGETAKRLGKEYIQELSRDDNDDDEDVATDSSDIDFGVEMIGRSRLFNTILQSHVLKRMRPDDRYVFSFWGGQGSSTRLVVKTTFEDAREGKCAQKFECLGWARVSRIS